MLSLALCAIMTKSNALSFLLVVRRIVSWVGRVNGQTRSPHLELLMERPIETEGKIVAVLPGTMFRVALANEHLVLAHISGRMRRPSETLWLSGPIASSMSLATLSSIRMETV